MTQSVTVVGKFSAPFEDGGGSGTFDLGALFAFTQREHFEAVYTEATTDDPVDFGSLSVGGAKACIVKCTVGACTIKFNGEALAFPLVPGAYFLYVNPSGGFLTAALVSTVGSATVKLLALG